MVPNQGLEGVPIENVKNPGGDHYWEGYHVQAPFLMFVACRSFFVQVIERTPFS